MRGRAFATQLSMRVLSRAWQMLLKGVERSAGVRHAGRRRRNGAGAHRLCRRSADAGRSRAIAGRRQWSAHRRAPQQWRQRHGARRLRLSQSFAPRYDAPRSVAALVGRGVAASGRGSGGAAGTPQPETPTVAIGSFEELIALGRGEARHLAPRWRWNATCGWCVSKTASSRSRCSRPRRRPSCTTCSRSLRHWTGNRWIVVVSKEQGAPTMRAQADARQAEVERDVQSRSAGAGGAQPLPRRQGGRR